MITLLVVLFTAGVLAAQEPPDTTLLIEKAKALEKKLAETKKKRLEEKGRDKAYRKRTGALLKKRKDELQSLSAEFEEMDQKIRTAQSSVSANERAVKEYEARSAALKTVIAEAAKALRGQIKAGFPAQAEKRIEPLDMLVRDIETIDITAEEALNRLWAIMDNEERFGGEIEVRNRDITLPSGVTAAVNELRLGKLALFYVSLDNKAYGILRRIEREGGTAYEWVTDNIDFSVRSALRTAIAVKTGKKPPQITEVPVYPAPERGAAQ